MRKALSGLSGCLLAGSLCFLSFHSFAQSDSSWLDLGTLKLKKDLTQSLSIRGSDLEKMPFTNLSDAINAWLYGAYSNASTLVYVVDGSLLADPNAYSIFDIEEIVFVQNALVQVNGAIGQQQLVLITTKRHKGQRSGLTMAGRSGIVNRDYNQQYHTKGNSSYTNAWHQYYAGAWINRDKVSFGASAGYQRDADPSVRQAGAHTSTPYKLDRYRINGYFDYRPDAGNEITLDISYALQHVDSARDFQTDDEIRRESTHQPANLFAPRLSWHSAFARNWSNDLQAAYLSSVEKVNGLEDDSSSYGSGGYRDETYLKDKFSNSHFYVRDRLSYTLHLGSWTLIPALNASYEHVKLREDDLQYVMQNEMNISYSSGYSHLKADLYFLTESLDLSYKNAFNFQGGVRSAIKLSSANSHGINYPFASVSTDLLKWKNPQGTTGLRLFVSYAQTAPLTAQGFQLYDLTEGPPANMFNASYTASAVFNEFLYTPTPGPEIYWDARAGATFSLYKDRLQVSYAYEKNFARQEFTIERPNYPGYISYSYFPNATIYTHHASLLVKPVDTRSFTWLSALNATGIHVNAPDMRSINGYMYYGYGAVNGDRPSWTGGWINQWKYRNFSLGLSLLYHFGEIVHNLYGTPTGPVNSILLQNIYLAYKLHAPRLDNLEIYLDSRNLARNNKNDLTDGRRYYGLGGKVGFR